MEKVERDGGHEGGSGSRCRYFEHKSRVEWNEADGGGHRTMGALCWGTWTEPARISMAMQNNQWRGDEGRMIICENKYTVNTS